METIARLPVRRRLLSLSGGKDSRLVAAAASAAGVLDRFVVRTHHTPGGSPDETVAGMVGVVLGVDVEKVERRAADLDPGQFEQRLRHHVFQTWGMHGAWDLKGNVPTSPNLGIGGLFGEVLRSYYAPDRRFDGADDVRRFFALEMGFDRAGMLRPEVSAELRAGVARWVERRLGEGVPPADLADVHYAEHRLRRWLGAVRHVVAHNPVADPLQLNTGFRTALAMGHDLRRVGAIPFELIRRLCEPLARVPLAGKGWHPAARAMAPEPDRYDVPPITGGSGGGHRWQNRRFPVLVPVFAAELLNGRGNPLLEMLDRERVAEVLSGRRRLDAHGKTALWATLAAAIWIDGGELPIRYQRHPSPTPQTTTKSDPAGSQSANAR
jgi:asparagine synthase (glutamine-hydrolysing)